MLDFQLCATHKPPSGRSISANLRHQINCPPRVSVQSNCCFSASIQLLKLAGMKVCKAFTSSNLCSFCCYLVRSQRSPLHISPRDMGFCDSYCPQAVNVLVFETACIMAAGGNLLLSWFSCVTSHCSCALLMGLACAESPAESNLEAAALMCFSVRPGACLSTTAGCLTALCNCLWFNFHSFLESVLIFDICSDLGLPFDCK